MKQYQLMSRDINIWSSFPKSADAKTVLIGQSLVAKERDSWAVQLKKNGAIHYGKPKTKVISTHFNNWDMTSDGLLCMMNGYSNSGKKIAPRCLFIETAKNGEIGYKWAFSNATIMRKGFIVAGDASKRAVK